MKVNLILIAAIMALQFAVKSYAEQASPLAQCREITDDVSRLKCYDKLPLNEPELVAPAVNKVNNGGSASADQRFGLKTSAHAGLDSIKATLTDLKKVGYGSHIFYLDNGQVWRQIDSGRFSAKVGAELEIKSASLGSFLMKKVGSNRTIRVKRIK